MENKDEKLNNALAEILNQLPDIDPHDDESWMVDRCFPKFESFISTLLARSLEEQRGKIEEEIEKYFHGLITIYDCESTKNSLLQIIQKQ